MYVVRIYEYMLYQIGIQSDSMCSPRVRWLLDFGAQPRPFLFWYESDAGIETFVLYRMNEFTAGCENSDHYMQFLAFQSFRIG